MEDLVGDKQKINQQEISSPRPAGWQETAAELIEEYGFVILKQVFSASMVQQAAEAIYRVRDKTAELVGRQRFTQVVKDGHNELRMPFLFDPLFYSFLEIDEVVSLLDLILGETAILRFFNVSMTVPSSTGAPTQINNHFHQNFPIQLAGADGKALFLECVFCLSDPPMPFGVVPGSHKEKRKYTIVELEKEESRLIWQTGDMLVMNPFLWHRELINQTEQTLLNAHLQFTRPFFKQHIDYMGALDSQSLAGLPERSRILLGGYTRVPTRIEDFYLPPNERPYRSGQW